MIDEVIEYIRENDFDIINLQEVGGKDQSKTVPDNFSYIKEKLGYKGELAISSTYRGDIDSYTGNATFYKPKYTFIEKEVIWLKPFMEVDQSYHIDRELTKQLPRNALALKFEFANQQLWVINTHLAWGPTPEDEPYKISQGIILKEFLKKISKPFLLSGDFNVTKDSEIVKMISELSVNHAAEANLTNTLNPHLHRIKELFPKGLAVDYIFTSFEVKTEAFSLVDKPDLSDHLGLRITLRLAD